MRPYWCSIVTDVFMLYVNENVCCDRARSIRLETHKTVHTSTQYTRAHIHPSSQLLVREHTEPSLSYYNRKYTQLGHSISWLLDSSVHTKHTTRFDIQQNALQHSTLCLIRELVTDWILRETCFSPAPHTARGERNGKQKFLLVDKRRHNSNSNQRVTK